MAKRIITSFGVILFYDNNYLVFIKKQNIIELVNVLV